MSAEERREMREDYPESPCTRVCTLDDNNVCLGCRRTMDEIVAWSRLSAAEQRRIIGQLPARRR